jgi:hypothetical protein
LMACCSCSIGKRECPGRCGKAFGRPRRFSRRPCKDTTP